MTRSEEALQRRAKKRNLSVEEMKYIEISSNKKKKVVDGRNNDDENVENVARSDKKSEQREVVTRVSTTKVSKKQETENPPILSVKSQTSDRWLCSACNNSNLCRISTTHCNRCQRTRLEVETKTSIAAVAPIPIVTTPAARPITTVAETTTPAVKPSSNHTRESNNKKKNVEKKQVKQIKNSSKKIEQSPPTWTCPVATQEKINENMKLRKLYEDPESRQQLSPEELERGRILVERSERKKNNKKTKSKSSSSSSVISN